MTNGFMYKIQKTQKYTEERLKEKYLTHLHTYGDHSVIYRAVRSLGCIPETNVTTCINSISVKKKSYINSKISNKTIDLSPPVEAFRGGLRDLDRPVNLFRPVSTLEGRLSFQTTTLYELRRYFLVPQENIMFLRHLMSLKSIQISVTYIRVHLDFRPLPWSLTFNLNQSSVHIKKCIFLAI